MEQMSLFMIRLADPEEVEHEYGLNTTRRLPEGKFEAVVLSCGA